MASRRPPPSPLLGGEESDDENFSFMGASSSAASSAGGGRKRRKQYGSAAAASSNKHARNDDGHRRAMGNKGKPDESRKRKPQQPLQRDRRQEEEGRRQRNKRPTPMDLAYRQTLEDEKNGTIPEFEPESEADWKIQRISEQRSPGFDAKLKRANSARRSGDPNYMDYVDEVIDAINKKKQAQQSGEGGEDQQPRQTRSEKRKEISNKLLKKQGMHASCSDPEYETDEDDDESDDDSEVLANARKSRQVSMELLERAREQEHCVWSSQEDDDDEEEEAVTWDKALAVMCRRSDSRSQKLPTKNTADECRQLMKDAVLSISSADKFLSAKRAQDISVLFSSLRRDAKDRNSKKRMSKANCAAFLAELGSLIYEEHNHGGGGDELSDSGSEDDEVDIVPPTMEWSKLPQPLKNVCIHYEECLGIVEEEEAAAKCKAAAKAARATNGGGGGRVKSIKGLRSFGDASIWPYDFGKEHFDKKCVGGKCPDPECGLNALYFMHSKAELKDMQEKLDKEYNQRKEKANKSKSRAPKRKKGSGARKSYATNSVKCMGSSMHCYGAGDGGTCPHCRDLARQGLLEQHRKPDPDDPSNTICACQYCNSTCDFGPFKLSQLPKIERQFREEKKKAQDSSGPPRRTGLDSLFHAMGVSVENGKADVRHSGSARTRNATYGAAASYLTNFEFEDDRHHHEVRELAGDPQRRLNDGTHAMSYHPTAKTGRHFANGLGQSGGIVPAGNRLPPRPPQAAAAAAAVSAGGIPSRGMMPSTSRAVAAAPAPQPNTPSNGMCVRVMKKARAKRHDKETSEDDKPLLGEMMMEGAKREGSTYALSRDFQGEPGCSQGVMEDILQIKKDERAKKTGGDGGGGSGGGGGGG